MATFKEIADRTNRQLEQEFDNQLYLDWINECLDDLTQDVFIPTKTVVTAQPSGEFLLPANYRGELRLRPVGETTFLTQVAYDETTQSGFAMYGGEITLVRKSAPLGLQLFYGRSPSKIINSPTAVPDIPEQFHFVIEAFCRMKAMLFIEDIASDERYQLYAAEYGRGRQQFVKFCSTEKAQSSANTSWQVIR